MNLQELKKIYTDVFYLEEDMILVVIIASAIATKIPGDPLWVLIVGGSSSGKSELINTLNKVSFVFPVSSMTENTFLSNMRLSDGKEASLLHEIGSAGMITMKDYTSILTMRPEKREVIISQMREIYDGRITKRSGNGKSEDWAGKINWIGGVTDAVYLAEAESAGMGRRNISYIMPEPDRKKTVARAAKNNADIEEKRQRIQDAFAEYIGDHMAHLPTELPEIPEDFNEELLEMADFITHVRTPTSRDYRGQLVLVPSLEMPMRVYQMFYTLTRILIYIHKGKNMDAIRSIIVKIAFDSIPKQTRLVLYLMAEHSKITSKGAAQKLRYPTETVRTWLENLNVLGICQRIVSTTVGADIWKLEDQFQKIIEKYTGIVQSVSPLTEQGEIVTGNEIQPAWMAASMLDLVTDDPGVIKEQQEKIQNAFDGF